MKEEPSYIQVAEDAFLLLKNAPASVFTVYFLGTCPFALMLIYFIADTTRNPFAELNLATNTLILVATYLFMKLCQVAAVRKLRQLFYNTPAQPTTPSWKVLLRQSSFHAWGFIILPIAGLFTVPFAHAFAYCQNLITQDTSNTLASREITKSAWRYSKDWVKQNVLLISLIHLVIFVVFINTTILILTGPFLMKMILGIDTKLIFGGFAIFNTTLMSICAAITFVITDPFVKACYIVRSYYLDARNSGQDILLALEEMKS